MTLLAYVLYFAALVGLALALAAWMARVYAGTLPAPLLGIERALLRACGDGVDRGMGWSGYAMAVLAFNAVGFLLLYAILRGQGVLPLNPDGIGGMSPDLAFNTAVSFVTNTNWQAYTGEAQLSYLSQMAGLTVQNFVSAGTGMAVALAVIRGFVAPRARRWAISGRPDPLGAVGPAAFVGDPGTVPRLAGGAANPRGCGDRDRDRGAGAGHRPWPAAAQIAIKQLGTNGGGFFGVNSAHPFENPTIASNMAQSLAILLVPVAFCFLFGRMTGDRRQGWAIFAAMAVMFVAGLVVIHLSEVAGNAALGAGANMEGKEQRFGAMLSALWAASTTAASNGSVNAMHDSFMPLSGLVMMVNMQIGEVIFGGVGAGLYGMLLYVVLAVFLAG